jgi:hypothetical protein
MRATASMTPRGLGRPANVTPPATREAATRAAITPTTKSHDPLEHRDLNRLSLLSPSIVRFNAIQRLMQRNKRLRRAAVSDLDYTGRPV